MRNNLFAICKVNGSLTVKKIRLVEEVGCEVYSLFKDQEEKLLSSVYEEIDFHTNSGYKMDREQIFTMDIPKGFEIFEETIKSQDFILTIGDIDINNFMKEGIKGLFVGRIENGVTTVLVQKFTAAQLLQKKNVFIRDMLSDRNTFRKLNEVAFCLDSSLVCLVQNGKIKFKSDRALRSIIDMKDVYMEATELEVQTFFSHASFLPTNEIDPKICDQTMRRLITAVNKSGILEEYKPEDIHKVAMKFRIPINFKNGKLELPREKSGMKSVLRFLDENIYKGEFSDSIYETNSKRII